MRSIWRPNRKVASGDDVAAEESKQKKPMTFQQPIPPAVQAKLGQFKTPWFDPLMGKRGGWVAGSVDGQLLAVAEKIKTGWRFWLVSMENGETIETIDLCAS